MGRPQSKLKKPNNPMEELELKKQRQIKKIREQKELMDQVKRDKNKNGISMRNSETDSSSQSLVLVPQSLTKEEYDQLAIDGLRKQLQNKFSSFVLNQLLLSVQFYVNFEREKISARQHCCTLEKEFNEKLQKYSVILPNVIDEAVQSHVRFQRKHGPLKNSSINLHTQAIYVVFENMEISKPHDTNYDVIPPICKVFIDTKNTQGRFDEKKMRQGYVRLTFGEVTRNRESIENLNSFRCIQSDPQYAESDEYENYSQLQEGASEELRSSCSSGRNLSTATYDYTYITSLNTHQPLSQLLSNSVPLKVDSSLLPDSCISNVLITKGDLFDTKTDDEDSDSELDAVSEIAETKVLEVRYLNSVAFLQYFVNILKEQLGKDLGLTENDLDIATWKGASVFTTAYEIIPALHFPHWPECAEKWKSRARISHINPFTGEQIQWPTYEMIRTVISFGCHAIPLGYATKKDRNLTRDLEWKIVFPEAERYLESNLSSTQVKVFMLCKALIKTYVEPKQTDDITMFSLDHLRTHLFNSCEQNYAAWPEEFLGEALIRFLKSFRKCLSMKYLPDYFIPKRNLFENIPESSMVMLHQTISQIIQNPVMHVMMAYRNLNLDGKFYPKLNYKKLYACIVVEDTLDLRKRMATGIRGGSKMYPKISEKNEEKISEDLQIENEQAEGLIGYFQKREMKDRSKRRKTKRLQQQEKLKMQKKLEAEQIRRASEDSIDLQFMIKDDTPVKTELRSTPDEVRRALVIEIFVNNFISMAKAAYKLEAFDQCKIYLNQTTRLCLLLSEYGYEESARKSTDIINRIRNTLQSVKSSEFTVGPALPLRRNLEPVRKLRQNKIKLDIPASNFDRETTINLKPETPTKSVQFKETCNFIEPRVFFVDADVHLAKQGFNRMKDKIKVNGILKQTTDMDSNGIDTSIELKRKPIKEWRKTDALDADEILEDDDSGSCTEL